MSHVALYRAWRPKVFADLIGQSVIVTTLQNAMKNNRIHHAYLFNGPRGTGKTSAAKLLAKAMNCRDRIDGIEPCNQCANCHAVQSGAAVDVLEIDAASNRGIDEIRELRENVRFAPVQVPYKVYIIDEVHMLTTEAFNALLKTLEEPPSHVVFILATTEPHKLPATIVSRCLRFDFRRIFLDEQMDRLRHICKAEQIRIDEEALRLVARLSEGGMRDALSLLEQAITFIGPEEKITHDELLHILGGVPMKQLEQLFIACNIGAVVDALPIMDEWIQSGRSVERILEQWMQMIRDLLLYRLSPDSLAWRERAAIRQDLAEKLNQQIPPAKLEMWLNSLDSVAAEIRNSTMPTLLLEMVLMKCCSDVQTDSKGMAVASSTGQETVQALETRIRQLEMTVADLRRNPPLAGQGASGIQPETKTTATRQAAQTGRAPSAAAPVPSTVLNEFRTQHDQAKLNQVLSIWPAVLQNIKEKKITLHAWLRDGEPFRFSGQKLLLLFKNAMHRDTIDKHTNREEVERTIEMVSGLSLRLVTMLQRDWDEPGTTGGHPDSNDAGQPFSLEPERNDSAWIDDAVSHFGKEAVTILDESD